MRRAALRCNLQVLFIAHGSGGSAYQCGSQPDSLGTTWLDVAVANNFNLVCGEAIQSNAVNNITGKQLTGGIWSMPEVIHMRTCTFARTHARFGHTRVRARSCRRASE